MEFVDRANSAGCSVQSHAASGVVICHASQDIDSPEQAQALIQPLRQLAESQQGSLVILQCPADWKTTLSVFGTPLPSWELMKTLKRTLDPQNRLSPGRLFAPE